MVLHIIRRMLTWETPRLVEVASSEDVMAKKGSITEIGGSNAARFRQTS